MKELKYDIENRDLVIENGTFVFEEHPSVQNGGILLYGRVFSLKNALFGVGMEQIVGSPSSLVAYELNRWKSQVIKDGGRALWSVINNNGIAQLKTEVNYE
jgi:hypothetical protein